MILANIRQFYCGF